MHEGILLALLCGAAAILYGLLSSRWIIAQPTGNDRDARKSPPPSRPAPQAYLGRQYRTIAIVGVVLFVAHLASFLRPDHRDRLRRSARCSPAPPATSA
jgi:K(+)-stimulated pyrophosphate-energized sodium pump